MNKWPFIGLSMCPWMLLGHSIAEIIIYLMENEYRVRMGYGIIGTLISCFGIAGGLRLEAERKKRVWRKEEL